MYTYIVYGTVSQIHLRHSETLHSAEKIETVIMNRQSSNDMMDHLRIDCAVRLIPDDIVGKLRLNAVSALPLHM